MPTTTRSAHASVHGALHGVGVVKEEHRAWCGWEWDCGWQEVFDNDVYGSEGEFNCCCGEWEWGGYDDVRYLFAFAVEIQIIDLCNIVDLGVTSGLIGHDPRDARCLEGGRVRVLLRDRS